MKYAIGIPNKYICLAWADTGVEKGGIHLVLNGRRIQPVFMPLKLLTDVLALSSTISPSAKDTPVSVLLHPPMATFHDNVLDIFTMYYACINDMNITSATALAL